MTKQKTASKDFTISLKLGNEVFASKGETMLDAIMTLPIPQKIFLKGVLTLKRGDKSRELIMPVLKVRRLFYKISQNVLAKQYELILK